MAAAAALDAKAAQSVAHRSSFQPIDQLITNIEAAIGRYDAKADKLTDEIDEAQQHLDASQ